MKSNEGSVDVNPEFEESSGGIRWRQDTDHCEEAMYWI